MNIMEGIDIRGRFQLIVRKSGKVIEAVDDHNMIVQGAKVTMARLLGESNAGKKVSKIAIGTNGTLPTVEDTAITGAYTKAIDSVSYPADGKVKFSWSIGSSEANEMEIIEFGLVCEDGTLFSRKVRTEALPKAADITLEGAWTISF